MFAEWIHKEYNRRVHDDTARRWLVKLGFSRVHHQKGVNFDGHDRDDVVQYTNKYLVKMAEFDLKSITYDNIPQLSTDEKPLIRVVHDECTLLC